jgi:putative ABC transport system substrate-binding protein
MRRRDCIALLGGAAAAWPFAARAQQPTILVIGILDSASPDPSDDRLRAFRQGLSETGYVDGRNVGIELLSAEGQDDRLPALATGLVHRRVAAIFSMGIKAALAAKAATATVPIVFVGGADPVRSGLVASLARPGGNITGVNFFGGSQLAAKRVELLNELVPQAAAIAVLLDPNYVESEVELRDAEVAGRAVGRQIRIVKAASERDFDAAFARIVQTDAVALVVGGGPYLHSQRRQLVALASRHALPAIYVSPDFVEAGGLMSYGSSQPDAYRRAGTYVGRIFKGEKPADLPIERSTKLDLVINLKTAKALGLTFPPSFHMRADEVIE